jgi:hypothetical protein
MAGIKLSDGQPNTEARPSERKPRRAERANARPAIEHTPMDTNQLVVSNGTSHQVAHQRQATEIASICKDIVTKTAQNIQGRKYVRVEGWQSIANAYGCVASAKDVERIETGFRAIGQVRKMDTGAVICEAEGFVGDDERTWAKRDEFAKRAMAQTRAISRACRSAFAFIVTYMDAGLETTPAEEVPAEGFSDSPRPAPANRPAPRLTDDVIDVVAERVAPAAPIRKKQPVAATPQAADYETVTLLKVARKEGTSAKGRPWTRWGIMVTRNGSEVWLNTFSEEFGAMIDEANQGDTFHVELKEGERGIDIVDLRVQDVPDRIETAEVVADEEIPF